MVVNLAGLVLVVARAVPARRPLPYSTDVAARDASQVALDAQRLESAFRVACAPYGSMVSGDCRTVDHR